MGVATPISAPAPQGGGGAGGAGLGLAAAGAITSAIGAYYGVKAMQYQARSQASALHLQQQLSYINARRAERDAQLTTLAGHREAAQAGQRYSQLKAATTARQSASGIQAGVGSAGEVAASIELAKQTDQMAITRNAVQAANARRAGRVNEINRGRAAGVSAQNMLATAGSINPYAAGATSLVGGSGRVAQSWYQLDRSGAL